MAAALGQGGSGWVTLSRGSGLVKPRRPGLRVENQGFVAKDPGWAAIDRGWVAKGPGLGWVEAPQPGSGLGAVPPRHLTPHLHGVVPISWLGRDG